MKKLSRLTAVTLLLMLVLSVPSYGWSDTGHMAVAFVAYQKLTPQVRARADVVNVRDNGATKRLHAFWDGLLGTSKDPAVAVTVGQGLPTAPAAAANNLNASDWVDESFADAKSTVYKQPPIGVGPGPFTITTSYRNAAKGLAKKRVALAGV